MHQVAQISTRMSFYESLPLLLLLGPPLSLLLSVFSLYQFGQVFAALSRAAQGPVKGPVPWQYFKQGLKMVVSPTTDVHHLYWVRLYALNSHLQRKEPIQRFNESSLLVTHRLTCTVLCCEFAASTNTQLPLSTIIASVGPVLSSQIAGCLLIVLPVHAASSINPLSGLVSPFLQVRPLTATLGDADKFVSTLQTTHVFLWAILIVLIVLLSGIRSELALVRPPRPVGRQR